ncbi:Hypothetical predicted protein [Mytilus galloprovincialis]|uniref:Ig-like domain-containing protein n=1 Tax=Mytilus galloprovincialis TaxID=29158 RepID=A0A8B6FNJ7_MYTGA|nr:Hypothetical predicted protein [Mytilus galloprovincialis]
MSTHATIKFDNLKCEDEKDYICLLTFTNEFSLTQIVRSDPSSISVKVSPSKPDNISGVIVWSAHSKKQEITSSTFLREGDTVTLTCTGNIGNPPGKFIWQKYSPQHNQHILYTNATTEKEEKSENCTFRGTSNITVHLTPDHFEAKYCCFEESQKDVAGMYVETEPLNIHFNVDELPSSKDSSLLKMVIVYVIPVVCVVLFIVICVAVIKHRCIQPKKKENEENSYQTLSRDGITVNADYASVIHTPNRPVGESGDNLVCSNGKEGNKNKSRKNASDRTIVYDEINQQTNLNIEVSKAQMSVSTDNGDHYDAICMNVAIQSSVNDG